jgi:hypothetical protein
MEPYETHNLQGLTSFTPSTSSPPVTWSSRSAFKSAGANSHLPLRTVRVEGPSGVDRVDDLRQFLRVAVRLSDDRIERVLARVEYLGAVLPGQFVAYEKSARQRSDLSSKSDFEFVHGPATAGKQ